MADDSFKKQILVGIKLSRCLVVFDLALKKTSTSCVHISTHTLVWNTIIFLGNRLQLFHIFSTHGYQYYTTVLMYEVCRPKLFSVARNSLRGSAFDFCSYMYT